MGSGEMGSGERRVGWRARGSQSASGELTATPSQPTSDSLKGERGGCGGCGWGGVVAKAETRAVPPRSTKRCSSRT